MNAADRVIRWSTALAVLGVAVVAAVASYEHASALVRAHGESGWTGQLIPLTVDGLIYASSMMMLDSARRKAPVPALARWLLGLGIAATLAANVAHGLGHGPVGTAVAAWPAVALVGSYELLTTVIRSSQAAPDGMPGSTDIPDPLGEQAAEIFADHLAADRVPSIRAIRAQLHVGQPRAQRLRLPSCRNCEAGGKSRCMSNSRGGLSSQRKTLERRLQRARSRRSVLEQSLQYGPQEARRMAFSVALIILGRMCSEIQQSGTTAPGHTRASSQETRSKSPDPLGPARRMGYSTRSGLYTCST
jgi:Protein of unknown function (DUF2637)